MMINGLYVEQNGNTFIVNAEDHEGSGRVVELNRALHVIKVVRGNNEHAIAAGTSPYANYRYFVETVSGDLLTVSETRQAVTHVQAFLRFNDEKPPYARG